MAVLVWNTDTDGFAFSVARVAYLTSDVVLSVQPALQTDTLFSKRLKSLKANKAQNVLSKGTPEVCGSNSCWR